jgi:hypothetical protein
MKDRMASTTGLGPSAARRNWRLGIGACALAVGSANIGLSLENGPAAARAGAGRRWERHRQPEQTAHQRGALPALNVCGNEIH